MRPNHHVDRPAARRTSTAPIVASSAEYFYAGSAQDLKKVYQGLSTRLIVEKKETEITALLATIGAVLVLLAAGLSTWWFGRIA